MPARRPALFAFESQSSGCSLCLDYYEIIATVDGTEGMATKFVQNADALFHGYVRNKAFIPWVISPENMEIPAHLTISGAFPGVCGCFKGGSGLKIATF